ncbi:DUF5655 domain-containing protein [Ilumatobacter nonamiensis]|uniref:DUF5655 domain-containing protein n=1 Tax=Ilumatobacter nonamiensis TaxID=467093 RepID=UPI0003496374|nr:DUF5655 domain-containing protein [Ilumatobacter nonamiensis]
MSSWKCPDCRRRFGSVGQGHMCQPGLTEREFLASSPDFVAPIFRRVRDHLVAVDREADDGTLIVDPLDGKVLFKNGPTFCILDVKKKWVAVGFTLRRHVESGRMSRKVSDYGNKFHHVVNVDDPAMIDEEFEEWLTDAYFHGSEPVSSADPMVPDDVDIIIAPPH